MEVNNAKVDTNMTAFYILTGANRWLGVRLEFIGATVVTLAASFAVIERESLSPGFAGLSISYALQLTGVLNWLVRMWTEAETQMVSVERIMQYAELQVEAPRVIPNNRPPSKPLTLFTLSSSNYLINVQLFKNV
jgi:ATP-binding cassette subfamily C (CFTR/MRP) protein 1